MKTIARLISVLFFPFFMPIYGILIFFTFDLFRFYPLEMIRLAFTFVVIFAALLPMLTIFVLSKLNVIDNMKLNNASDRILPYSCTILSFMVCTILLYRIYMPAFIYKTMFASSIAILICLILNFKWKISSHTTSIGCLFGGLLLASLKMMAFPSVWIYSVILAAGLISSARLYLHKNTEEQLLGGFVIGSASTLLFPLLSVL